MDVGMSLSDPGFQSLAEKHVFFVFWAVLFAIAVKEQKNKIGFKKQWFDDYESVEIVARRSCVKSYQRKTDERTEFFTFITNCKSFRPKTFL
jgi:hypothetical protein